MKRRSAYFTKRSISRQFITLALLIAAAFAGAVTLTVYYLLAYKHSSRIEASCRYAAAADIISGILSDMLIVVLVVVFAAIFVIIFIVKKKISEPIRDLIAAADSISQGNLNAAIPHYPKSAYDIAIMSVALSRMVEQFRIHAHIQAQTQAVTAAQLQFGLFVKEANSVPQAFRMALSALRYRFESLRITAVYTNPDPAYALFYHKGKNGEDEIREETHFSGHAEVMSLLAEKRTVFLNAFVMKEQGVGFAGDKTVLACLVSLVEKRKLPGYIIIESENREDLSVVKEAKFLLQVADGLSEWLSTHNDASLTIAGPEASAKAKAQNNALAAFRGLDELDVDAALESIGGLEDVYERSIRLFVKLFPETLEKTDAYLKTDIKAFAIEIHGLKGSFNNMGAPVLGAAAARIEDAAKSGGAAYCEENYPSFRDSMVDFHKRLTNALPPRDVSKKQGGDMKLLKESLDKAKAAAEGFDAFEAKNIMQKIAEFTYNPETDSLVEEIAMSLERFDCAGAVQFMDRLGGVLK